ncbi:hypothetical protein FBR02_17175 [Anaerolineae bacterium CFX9]|jgi:DMSO reductase anchor subunit|nr:hypothetical protein [Anaerolineae bacterium CFX9]
MDWGIAILLTLGLGFMMFLVQRAEPRRRLLVLLAMLLAGELIRRYVWFRDVHSEALFALVTAFLINFFFWALIGRYNPVGSSDRIQVIGMED